MTDHDLQNVQRLVDLKPTLPKGDFGKEAAHYVEKMLAEIKTLRAEVGRPVQQESECDRLKRENAELRKANESLEKVSSPVGWGRPGDERNWED